MLALQALVVAVAVLVSIALGAFATRSVPAVQPVRVPVDESRRRK